MTVILIQAFSIISLFKGSVYNIKVYFKIIAVKFQHWILYLNFY